MRPSRLLPLPQPRYPKRKQLLPLAHKLPYHLPMWLPPRKAHPSHPHPLPCRNLPVLLVCPVPLALPHLLALPLALLTILAVSYTHLTLPTILRV